jgi:BirA family biotin operon repressor/biotin-[acetyl-CoA-carboxylase] ligase
LTAIIADGQCHSVVDLARRLGLEVADMLCLIEELRNRGLEFIERAPHSIQLSDPLTLLDTEQIQKRIASDAAAHLRKLDVLFETNSTNQVLLARRDDIHGCVCVAEFQHAGRGRLGRRWLMPLGAGLCFSVGWRFTQTEIESLSSLSLVVGVALMRWLHALRIPDAGIKWPNDILQRGQKLAGVLIETRFLTPGDVVAVVGIGVNHTFPPGFRQRLDQPWTDLQSTAPQLADRNILLGALLSELMPVLNNFASQGLAPFIDEWRRGHALAGQRVHLIANGSTETGTVVDVADDGALIVRVQGQDKRFAWGEVSIRHAE